MDNSELTFRPARPGEQERILEIIGQAQAQMRAAGSDQWQDGYPARADIDAYMERGFKTVCMDYVTFNYDYTFIGKLRRKDDSRDSVIDFVASVTVDDVRRIIIARCRLFGDPFNKSDLDILMERGKKVDGSNKLYALFSGPGFDPDLQAVARDDSNVVLRTLDEVYKG